MPRFYAIKQYSAGDHVAVLHKVTIPLWADKGFYRQIMSLNAFFHGRNDRNNFWALHPKTAEANGHKPSKPTHAFWYYGLDWEEFEADKKSAFSLGSAYYSKIPVVEHASMWDFYEHIGFDYKTGKYMKTGAKKASKKPISTVY